MIELLRTSVLSDDDFQYIEDYDAHKIGVENYNEKVERVAQKRIVHHMRLNGYSAEQIAHITDIPLSVVNSLFREFENKR